MDHKESQFPTSNSFKQPGQEDGNIKGNHRGLLKRVLIVLLFLALVVCIIGLAIALVQKETNNDQDDVTQTPPTDDEDEAPTSASGKYRFAAVAADNAQCSQIGTDIMARLGGNAVDSAIATLLCLGVLNSQSMGIGGGFLMTIYNSTENKVISLNSREVAPLAATEDMFVNRTKMSTLGGLAIAVPGEIAGYAEAHRRYGQLSWSDLFQPTIKLCMEGYVISEALGSAIKKVDSDVIEMRGLVDLFMKPDGTLYATGDVMTRPVLAETLRRMAADPDTYYNGSLADDIIKDIEEYDSIITSEDLLSYTPLWKEPIETVLSNGHYTLYGPPPPSSAVILYYILNIMDGFGVSPSDRENTASEILLAHRLVEAMKFGFGKRSYLGDEDFVNVTELVTRLQTDTFADETRMKINDDKVLDLDDYDSAYEQLNDGGTSHLSVYGPDGSAVSVTSTINTYFGSKVRGNRTGIIFNNEMDDFSTTGTDNAYQYAASPTNFIVPGKRPMSSMSPTIVMNKNNRIAAIAGASGGSRIISGTLEVLMNTLWLGYNVSEAVDQPRYHDQLIPNEILHEINWPLSIREGLARKGHKFRVSGLCVVQLIKNICNIEQDDNTEKYCIRAASDVRKGGAPDGY